MVSYSNTKVLELQDWQNQKFLNHGKSWKIIEKSWKIMENHGHNDSGVFWQLYGEIIFK